MTTKQKRHLKSSFACDCFILHRSYSISFNLSNVGEIFWSCIRKLRKRKRKFCVVFTYSRKKAHEIRKFCVTVVQRLLRNLQECDARAALLFCYYFFTGSCCLRRRRWFSSLMLWSRNSATMVMWRHTSSLYRFNFKETGLIFRTSCLMGINWSIFYSEHSLQKLADPCHMFPQNALIPWLVGSQLSLICHFHTSFKTFPRPITYIEEQGWCTGESTWSPPTIVAQVQILVSTPHVGWVCCWCSPLLREVILHVLQFSPPLKNHHFQILIQPGNQVDEEPLSRCATSKLLFIYILIYWKVSMFWRLFWLIISWTLTFMKLLGSRPGTNESFE